MFKLCYNANGLRSLPLEAAINQVSKHGYDGIELSWHPNHIMPYTMSMDRIKDVRNCLNSEGVHPACLATGFDTLLSTKRFEPSLTNELSEGRKKRIDVLKRSMEIASELNIPVINFASGSVGSNISYKAAHDWLIEGISELLKLDSEVKLALEPEPDMYIDTCEKARVVIEEINSPRLGLNLDVGHAQCLDDGELSDIVREALPFTFHVHIEDIKGKIHHHEIPGEGDIDFHAICKEFLKGNYNGYISIELYHHSHIYDKALRESKKHLDTVIRDILGEC